MIARMTTTIMTGMSHSMARYSLIQLLQRLGNVLHGVLNARVLST
jgi:hypothetical protein